LKNGFNRASCIHSVAECGLDIGGIEQGHGDVVKRSTGSGPALPLRDTVKEQNECDLLSKAKPVHHTFKKNGREVAE
jgi:hypothetical protein